MQYSLKAILRRIRARLDLGVYFFTQSHKTRERAVKMAKKGICETHMKSNVKIQQKTKARVRIKWQDTAGANQRSKNA